jgi:signal transduction histidine kinase
MSLEPFIAFFIVQQLRKTLKRNNIRPDWLELSKYVLYGIGVLFVLNLTVFEKGFIDWIWHAFVLLLLWIIFKREEFQNLRTVMFAVLPLILASIITDIAEAGKGKFFERLKFYTEFIYPFAIIWMVTQLIIFNRQQKALAKERDKRIAEEEQHKIIAAKKDELEEMVAERTAELMKQKEELQEALNELTETQNQLIHAAKMASLGELTAGIAHEIQNPLNFVNNFSEVNQELIDEMNQELSTGNLQEAMHIASDIKENNSKITHHGKRADAIVKGMLQHSRTTTGVKELTDLNALVDEYLRLSYHGLRAKDKSFNVHFDTSYDPVIEKINIVPQDIGRVLLNLFNNAFYAVTEKKKLGIAGYEPVVTVITKKDVSIDTQYGVVLIIKDNGTGIPEKVLQKIFQPFFTTKPTGIGTGLGLSLSYDTIKAHGGEISVNTKEGEFTEFVIHL